MFNRFYKLHKEAVNLDNIIEGERKEIRLINIAKEYKIKLDGINSIISQFGYIISNKCLPIDEPKSSPLSLVEESFIVLEKAEFKEANWVYNGNFYVKTTYGPLNLSEAIKEVNVLISKKRGLKKRGLKKK